MPAPLARDAKLLVWMPRWLGDFQMAEPVVAALAAYLEPGALTLAMPSAYLGLYAAESFELEPAVATARTLAVEDEADFERALRGCDAVLLLRGSFRSAWRAWRAGAPRRIGWARDGRGLLLTDAMAPPREVAPGVRRILPRPFATAAAELLAMVGVPVRRTEPRLVPTAAARAALASRLERQGLAPGTPFVLLNAGGRADSAKALEDWAPIVRPLLESSRSVVAVAGPGEQFRLEALVRAVSGMDAPSGPRGATRTGKNSRAEAGVEIAREAEDAAAGESVKRAKLIVLDDPVPSLPELAALGAACDLALTTDGGPRHLFAAAGARQIVLFGPTDPRHTASHLRRTELFVGRVPCGPCHEELCREPAATRHACFAAIDTETLVRAALSLGPPRH